MSEEIHERFFHGYANVKLPHKFKIAVGGCPNNCVKPNLNDIGIIGQRIPEFEAEKCRGCKVCQIENTCKVKAVKLWTECFGLMKMSVITVVSVLENVRSKRLRTVHTVTESISAEDGAREL